MNWDDLLCVLVITRDKTLSQAAKTLGVSHTTVGRRLRAFERTLGVRLFDRTPEGFLPTPAGQDIVEVAARTESEVLALEGRILGRDAALKGTLRVATMDLLFRRYQPAFASFMERYPSIMLTVTASDDQVSLLRREAEVVLRLTNTPPDYLVGRRVARVEFAVFGSAALVLPRAGVHGPHVHAHPGVGAGLEAGACAVPDARSACRDHRKKAESSHDAVRPPPHP